MSKAFQTIAYFVSSHGLGHATRSVAIINEIHTSKKKFHFLIVSDLPNLFWRKNLNRGVSFNTYRTKTDIGLFQTDPFQSNIPKSVELLELYLQKPIQQNISLLKAMEKFEICHVVCDISPLGIRVANYLGLTTTLIENFTWDWIYQPLISTTPQFKEISNKLKEIFNTVHLRIQATPFCEKIKGSVEVQPVHREFQNSPSQVYEKLNIAHSQKLILVATSGKQFGSKFKQFIKESPHCFISCNSDKCTEIFKPTTKSPVTSRFHFPDLIRASSAVIGKIGYGMTVECWAAETKLIGIIRENFRESEVLKNFIIKEEVGIALSSKKFIQSNWHLHLEKQIEYSSKAKFPKINGNGMAAKKIIQLALS